MAQTRTNKRTGEVQEMRGGQWVTITPGRAAGPAPAFTIPGKPPSPTQPYDTQKARNEAAASNFDPAQSAANVRKTNVETDALLRTTPVKIAGEQADARAKIVAAKKAERDAAEEAEKQRRANESAIAELNRTIVNIDALKGDAVDNNGWFETGLTGSWLRNRPGTAAFDLGQQVDTIKSTGALTKLMDMKQNSPTGGGMGGQTSDRDIALLENSIANLNPDQSLGQFTGNLDQAREVYADMVRRMGGTPVPLPGEAPVPDQEPQAGMALSNGRTRTEVDPILKGVAARVGAMVSGGKSDAEIRKFIADNGVDLGSTNIDTILKYRATNPEFKLWKRQNPGKAYPIGPSFYTREVPLTTTGAIMNSVAQSPISAGVVAAGNAVTGNRLDDLVALNGGDAELARTGMQLLRTQNPKGSLLGDIAGQAAFEYTAGRLPGVRGLGASAKGLKKFGINALSDASYGAYSGSGDGGVEGAITGAGLNAGLGVLGRGLSWTATGVATGVRNADLGYLDRANVSLTPGRIGRGSDTITGDIIGGAEEIAAGTPILRDIINPARRRGDVSLNEAAFREMGGSGLTGSAGIAEGKQIVDNAYSFLDNTTLPLDAQYAGNEALIRAGLPSLPRFGPEIGTSLDRTRAAAAGGDLAGRDWQSAVRSAKSNRASITGKEFSDDAVNTLTDVETNLLQLAERQGPPGTVANLGRANDTNKKFQTLVRALDNGPAQRADELFSGFRLDDASRQGANAYGGKVASLSGERPFYRLSKAANRVMPNLTPDSGTAGRALAYAAAIGAAPGLVGGGVTADEGEGFQDTASGGAGGALTGLGVAGTLAALYSPVGQKAAQKVLLGRRPNFVRDLQAYLKRRPTLSNGLYKAPALGLQGLGRDYFFLDELPEE